jgi:hypothetical protein
MNTVPGLTYKETEDVFKSNLDLPEDLLHDFTRNAVIPQTSASAQATLWLEHYFKAFGNEQMALIFLCFYFHFISHCALGDTKPNGLDIAVAVNSKNELYTQYVDSLNRMGKKTLSIQSFLAIWRNAFPHCRLREEVEVIQFSTCWFWVNCVFYCFFKLYLQVNIVGKCRICSTINQQRKVLHVADSVREALKEAHIMHSGGYFMKERLQYESNVRRQALYPEKVCCGHTNYLCAKSMYCMLGNCFSGYFLSVFSMYMVWIRCFLWLLMAWIKDIVEFHLTRNMPSMMPKACTSQVL